MGNRKRSEAFGLASNLSKQMDQCRRHLVAEPVSVR